MHFSDLRLSPPILRAVEQEGYTTPTPIQQQTIPPIMDGRDVLGCAQTGTGKTAAFALPILHRLMSSPVDKTARGPKKPRVLVLAPTRELAAQIADSFATYGRESGITYTVIFGGVSQYHQAKALQRGVDVLIATPGRLIDLMEQRIAHLDNIDTLILDEADRMLDMGFIEPIRRIAAATKKSPERQTLLFSATMPKAVAHLAASLLSNPVKISVTPVSSAAPKIDQGLYLVGRAQKQSLLHHLLQDGKIGRAVVFTRTKHGADRVGRRLQRAGITAEIIHGDRNQSQRTRALARFSSGASRVLVATDVAARGLDVDGITHVFNFDLPVEPEAYIHRIGRTARAGASGHAVSFCDGEERPLLKDIERLTGKQVPVLPMPAIEFLPAEPREQREPQPQAYAPRPHGRPQRSSTPHPHAHGTRGPGKRSAPGAGWRGQKRRASSR
jgi:ATP-dependent RNA helicase RhlE